MKKNACVQAVIELDGFHTIEDVEIAIRKEPKSIKMEMASGTDDSMVVRFVKVTVTQDA